jgi:hypothetical protein
MKTWTDEYINDLKRHYADTKTSALAVRYGKTTVAVKAKAKVLGLHKNTHHQWTAADDEILRSTYSNHALSDIKKALNLNLTDRQVYMRASVLELKKSREFIAATARKNMLDPNHKGRIYWIKKGQAPPNKGKKQIEYMTAEAIERTKATRFKKGQLPHNALPEGCIVKRKHKRDGRTYKFISTGKKMVPYHRYLWEQAYGKIPKGTNIQFKDENPLNCVIENLYAIRRTEQMVANSGSANLPDGMVAFYLSGKSGKDRVEIEALKKYPQLLDIKRKQILLNRKIRKNGNN